jgi:glycine cleavage system H protein
MIMVAIFVAFMFISLVLVDLGLEKWKVWQSARASRLPASVMTLAFDPLYQIPEGVHFSNAHTWSRPDPAGGLEIGADALITHAVGPVRRIVLPKVGDQVAAGQPLFGLERDGRSITVPSPFTGTVLGVNFHLEKEPELLNSDPFGRGWVCSLTPTHVDEHPVSMLFGEKAAIWAERESARFREFVFAHIPPTFALGATSHDGGLPAIGCLAELDAKAWNAFEAEFLQSKQP